jgi:hypothetical protein
VIEKENKQRNTERNKRSWREMIEQEMKHGGTTREEKQWNTERNEGDKKWNM